MLFKEICTIRFYGWKTYFSKWRNRFLLSILVLFLSSFIFWFIGNNLSPSGPQDAIYRKHDLFDRFYSHRFFCWQSLSSEPGTWPFTAFHVPNVQRYREIHGVIFGSFRCIHVGREKPLLVQSQPTARD